MACIIFSSTIYILEKVAENFHVSYKYSNI